MSDLISRCELFNKLATVHPRTIEESDLKGEIYKIIQSMEAADVRDDSDPEKEYLDLICEIQHQAIANGNTHVGNSSDWCIFGKDIKAAIEELHKKRHSGDAFI